MTDLDNICRACLKSSRNLVNFDDKINKTITIIECFENLTSLNATNRFEQKICKICFQKMKSAYEFKQLCIENDAIYQDLMAMAGTSEGLKIKSELYSTDEEMDTSEMLEVEVEPGYIPKKLARKAGRIKKGMKIVILLFLFSLGLNLIHVFFQNSTI
jgi:hypothetical protein